MNKNCNNWRVAFLQLCIDTNAEAEFSPLECTQIGAPLRNTANRRQRGGRALRHGLRWSVSGAVE